MLISTLNYNQPELTDNLIKQLTHDKSFNSHELMVVDNGSSKQPANSTTHKLEENLYFGGGLNIVLEYFLQSRHEYFVLFNNDLIFHGPRLLTNMVQEMRDNDLSLYSPAITNTGADQCFWKQMWNWGTGTVREVQFIDFMCPVMRRDLAEAIVKFPDELFLGWGADFYSGMIAEQNGMKVGVSDNITLSHLVSQTFKTGAIEVKESDFCRQADGNMHNYFLNNAELNQTFVEFRTNGANYHA
jgi:GT2 family glycosyltransferase